MAPARPLKRRRTNTDQVPTEPLTPSQVPLPPDTPTTSQSYAPPSQNESNAISRSSTSRTTSSQATQPWYRTWPRKATSITQLAHETASIASDAASEVSTIIRDKTTDRRASLRRNPSLAMTLGKGTSNRSLPVDATTTNVHAVPEAVSPSGKRSSQSDLPVANGKMDRPIQGGKDPVQKNENAVKPSETEETAMNGAVSEPQQEVSKSGEADTAGWFAWMAKKEDVPVRPDSKPPEPAPSTSKMAETPPNLAIPMQPAQDPFKGKKPETAETSLPGNKRTWLQMWGGDTPTSSGATTPNDAPREPSQTVPLSKTNALEIPQPGVQDLSSGPSQASSIETAPPALPGDSKKSAGWVFWSRDKKNNTSSSLDGEQPRIGEIAVSDTPSQTRPKRASISVPKDREAKPIPKIVTQGPKESFSANPEPIKHAEKHRPGTPTTELKGQARKDSTTTKLESPNATARAQEPADAISRAASPAPSNRYAENLLLPPFHETLHLQEDPSILQQLARLLYYTKEPEFKHLSIVRGPPRIRNALAIGVHGYFPGPMVRTLLGQPTGTSIKFADMAAKSIKKWSRGRGYDCQVKTAALEGEGKIDERVELLWKLLLNWIDEIRRSDFVMVACHSQGVPVAIMLVAKLIQFGCLTSARVGICAMAGVSMGPFADYKSRWISGSAGELFEFSDPSSKVSQNYLASLDIILKAGIRLTYVGSIDDQLVSLESSVFAPVTHPHIYRAVSIDSRVHAPSFLSHLVGFVFKLRNLGVSDHGVTREISSPLAGSLYTGDGHSRIYEDDAVYDLAVSFALETTALMDIPLTKRDIASSSGNPYVLPFAMRGVLEEDFVKNEFQEEAQQLLKQFDDWRPTTKALKDVKFRLEGIRSKL